MNENKKHCTFDVYQNLIENTMFIKRHNQKLFLKRADQFIDFIDRNNILNAIESDDNLLIYSLEKTNNSLINKVNKLTSLIINSNDRTLIKKMNDSWLQ